MELITFSFIYFYLDKWYFILVIPCFFLSLFTQFLVMSSFRKYSQMRNQRGLTGAATARKILENQGLYDITIEPIRGSLTDHFNPRTGILRLSEGVYDQNSVAALGVAAHEVGHAIQHASGYSPLTLRQIIYPVAAIGSSTGPYMAILGLAFRWDVIFNIGIILFSLAVLFYFITLPVEFNASKRALTLLESGGYLTSEAELQGAKIVLRAAALTYVASAALAFANLLRIVFLKNDRDDR